MATGLGTREKRNQLLTKEPIVFAASLGCPRLSEAPAPWDSDAVCVKRDPPHSFQLLGRNRPMRDAHETQAHEL